MTNIREQYTNELYDKFGYYATWEPGTIREIGEVGELKDNEFIRLTSLKNLGVQFSIRTDNTKHDLNYTSKGTVTVTQKLKGSATPAASKLGEMEAGYVIEFGKENSILLKAIGVSTEQIDDQVALSKEIIRLFKDKQWEKHWVVITELKHAESATIIISNSANSKIEISAKAAAGQETLNIANAELGLSVVSSSGINTEIIGKKDLTPLFKLKGIKTSFFSPNKPILENKGVDPEEEDKDKKDTTKVGTKKMDTDESELEDIKIVADKTKKK